MALWMALAIVPATFAPSAAEPKVSQSITYYDVTGASAAAVRTDLDQLGPMDQIEGRRHDAVTHWNIRWRYSYSGSSSGCRIASVAVTVDATTTMPRLKSDAASTELTDAFASFADKLLAHEKDHAQNALDTARRIEHGIGDLPPESSCDQLGRIANALGERLLEEGRRLDVEYDARTQHGRSQGARFP
jgi:predicted secreted Zn-dependent protease